jgi:hypothetical protein
MTAPVAAVLSDQGWNLWVEDPSGPQGGTMRAITSMRCLTLRRNCQTSEADFMFLRDDLAGVISCRASNDGRVGTWPARPPRTRGSP